jgi:Domain of unknown function (DUF1707)/Cell wall-active antibiotics response 4TMS YvqF
VAFQARHASAGVGARHWWSSVGAMADASIRVSDDDRERAVLALREHLLAGRLTLEEFSGRVEAALRARAAGDLARVQEDLPDIFVEAAGSHRKAARVTTALFGHVAQRGRQRLRRRALAASGFGDLDFDLREVTVDQWQTTVTVLAAFGNVDVYVPEGINVEVTGVTVFGHRRDWGRDADRPDAPTIHVHVLGFAGTIDVWRVPQDMRDASYSDIFRQLEDRQHQLPG